MNTILNPNKMIREDVNCPTKKELLEAKELINQELSDRRYEIMKYFTEKKYPNYGNFIAISCDTIFQQFICNMSFKFKLLKSNFYYYPEIIRN